MQGTTNVLGGLMVVRKGQDGVQYLFTEETFGDQTEIDRVKAEVCHGFPTLQSGPHLKLSSAILIS